MSDVLNPDLGEYAAAADGAGVLGAFDFGEYTAETEGIGSFGQIDLRDGWVCIGMWFDAVAGKVYYGVDGVEQGEAFSSQFHDVAPYYTNLAELVGADVIANFGDSPWMYDPPDGYFGFAYEGVDMTIAQKISKQTVMRRQTGLGNVGAATGQIMRRTNSVFKATRNSYKSNEVVSHHQSTGASYGLRKTDGTLAGELSSGTYQMQIEAMLEAVYSTAATTGALTTIAAASGTPDTFTDSANGFLTAGFKIGMVVRATGFSGAGAAACNSRNFWITALTAGVMSGLFLDGTAMVSDAAGEAVTIAEVGKHCKVPLTSHIKSYLQVEEWYGDLTDSDLFNDVIVAGIDFDLPASGNAGFSSSYVGLARTLSGSQVMTGPTAETSTGIMAAINGRMYVNGTTQPLTGLKLSLKNGAADTGAEVGSNSASDVVKGPVEVEGSFTAMLRDQVVSALLEAETAVSLAAVVTADETATSHFMSFILGKIKVFGDAPDDNLAIARTYTFTAEINRAGGAALAWDDTIITIQDSAAT